MTQLGESSFAIQSELEKLERALPHYQAQQHVYDALAEKAFTSISGPVGVGKTTITEIVTRDEPKLLHINTTTNRPRKGSDPESFKTASEGVTFDQLKSDIEAGNVVNYAVIPQTGHVYATYPQDFPGEYNIGPVVSHNVDAFLNVGFREYKPIFVLSPVETWQKFMQASVSERPDALAKRAFEALESLEFARNNIDANTSLFDFVENKEGAEGLHDAALAVSGITLHRTGPIVTPDHAQARLDEMIAYARQLAVH